jgi:DNA-binding protein YbaB
MSRELPPLPPEAAPDLRRAHEMISQLTGALAGLDEVRYSGAAADGGITATVDGNGKLLDVYVSPHALRAVAPEDLGALALAAIQEARTAAIGGMRAAFADATGAELPDPATLETPDRLGFDLR